ncbi:hypothetical protein NGUA07_01632 [Salmonella enterica]|nr:hypothetical protein NGUA02_00008 [Salmonella enterica]GAR24226.1 hypothetical protein NGUA07_01632 [Salmonella enterica]GAR67240.1 hypothetical protein NGUA16_04099 [Salmonella enterica]GAR76937.1 hypothetical protein NGUA18_04864 [Salmonella enterica]GAS19241.1 hypothetical protein NGUA28_01941 [Salmonella enterica]
MIDILPALKDGEDVNGTLKTPYGRSSPRILSSNALTAFTSSSVSHSTR